MRRPQVLLVTLAELQYLENKITKKCLQVLLVTLAELVRTVLLLTTFTGGSPRGNKVQPR